MKYSKILGTGHYLPERVFSNSDWEKIVDTTDEWITSRTGIKERHFVSSEQAASDLVAIAGERALVKSGLAKNEIDLIIVGTITPDTAFPSTACWVQKKLGMSQIPAFDVSAACCGFLFALIQADSLIRSGVVKNVLVAGVEVLSKFIDWQDRNTCVLFGDGAGAAILGASDERNGILSSYWGAEGNLADLLMQPAGGSSMPPSQETIDKKLHTVHMKGNEVFRHAVFRMQESAMIALEKAGWSSQDVDLFIPHQANIRIIEATIKRAEIPIEKTFINIDKIGNVSSATIPIALDQAILQNRITHGSKVLLSAFGGGFTWGAVTIEL